MRRTSAILYSKCRNYVRQIALIHPEGLLSNHLSFDKEGESSSHGCYVCILSNYYAGFGACWMSAASAGINLKQMKMRTRQNYNGGL